MITKATCHEITNIGRFLEKAVGNRNDPRHDYHAVLLERLRAYERKAKSGNATNARVTRTGKTALETSINTCESAIFA